MKYDGYYKDRIPEDDGRVSQEFDFSIIKKIALVVAGVIVVIVLSVLAMKYL